MGKNNRITATLENGRARVDVGEHSLEISRSDEIGGSNFCPVELISASLGS